MESDGFKSRHCGNGVVDSCQNSARDRIKLIRLRYHLAAEGCPDSQVSLARSLLQDVECSSNDKENSELAVRWLLMAAEEGHEEAQYLLEKCYQTGVGITHRNKEKVEACLKSGNDEKLAHHVGNRIFRMMTYDTEDEVPLDFFVRNVTSLLQNGVMSDIISEETCDQRVTVKDVENSVLQCLHLQSPELNLVCRDKLICERKNPIWQLVTRLCTTLYNYLQNMQNELCKFDIIIEILLLFSVAPMMHSLYSLAYQTWLYCFLFSIMLFVSARILHMNMQYRNIVKWQQTISLMKHNETLPEPKRPLVTELVLYLVFILILSLFIGGFNTLICDDVLSISALFSLLMILSVLHQSSTSFTKLAVLAHTLLIVLTYIGVPFLHSGFFNAYLLLKMNIYGMIFSLNYLLFCLITVITGLAYTRCTARYEFILHILCIAWLRVFVLVFSSCSCVKVGLFFFCIIPLAKSNNILLNVGILLLLHALMFGNGFSPILLLGVFIIFKYLASYLLKKVGAKVILIILPLVWYIPFEVGNSNRPTLDWNQYAQACYKTSHQLGNTAKIQDTCLRFRNSVIVFESAVSKVEQLTSENPLDKVVSSLPLSCHLRCLLGEPYDKCKSTKCDLLRLVNKCPCHLDRWRSTTYRILVSIKTTFRIIGEVELLLENACKNFVYSLQQSDVILVKGLLKSGLGTDIPQAVLISAKCLNCVENVSCDISRKTFELWTPDVFTTNTVAFFLGPFVRVERSV